jgi:hypothetical protein
MTKRSVKTKKAGRKPKTDPPYSELERELVRGLALALPGVEEATSYGTPAFKVRGRIIARLHQDGESLVIKIDLLKREILINAEPATFYITDHYRCWPYMLVRLSEVRHEMLKTLIEDAWRMEASQRLIEAYEGKS